MANRNAGGNRAKSAAQHELDGTLRKDRHADLKNPEPTPGRPEAPADLSEVEQAEWGLVCADMERTGALFIEDRAVLIEYVKLHGETSALRVQQEEARAGLRVLEDNLGDVVAEDKVALFGQIVALHKTVSKCTDQLRQGRMAARQFLVELGLTPASRGRIKLPAKKAQTDEFAAFQQARPSMALVK